MCTDLEYIAGVLVQDQDQWTEFGLAEGKMGLSLFFYELSARRGRKQDEIYAEHLLEECLKHIGCLPCNFDNGLHGIGWGIQYLINRHFIDGEANEVLYNIDKYCWRRFFAEERSFDKWMSCTWYFQERIKYQARKQQALYRSILRQQMIYVIDDAEDWLCFDRFGEGGDAVWMRNRLLWSGIGLMALHQLDIFNYKVERAIKRFLAIIAGIRKEMADPDKMILSLILKKVRLLQFESFDITEELSELEEPKDKENLAFAQWDTSDKMGLLNVYHALRLDTAYLLEGGISRQDIEDLRKEKRYGLANGLAGLGWELLKMA